MKEREIAGATKMERAAAEAVAEQQSAAGTANQERAAVETDPKGRARTETTELVFVLDRSGSMAGLEKDTIGGFNSMIERQREQPGRGLVTCVLFDHEVETIAERVPLDRVRKLTRKQYYVRGCTALLDAVGQTIERVNAAQKASLEKRPDHTVFVITTDGMENASKHFSQEDVRRAINKRTKKNGWEFMFLGANIDAVNTAGNLGICADHAADYLATPEGTEVMYGAVDTALCSIRAEGCFDASWKDCLAE